MGDAIMSVALFLAVIALAITAGIVISVRFARAERDISRLTRDEAICREAERAESDLCARWWLR